MQQLEADIIAKAIRNLTRTPIGYKEEFVSAICKGMLLRDQFFNVKRFRTIALDVLPPGWPNQVDAHYDQNKTSNK